MRPLGIHTWADQLLQAKHNQPAAPVQVQDAFHCPTRLRLQPCARPGARAAGGSIVGRPLQHTKDQVPFQPQRRPSLPAKHIPTRHTSAAPGRPGSPSTKAKTYAQ
ncbi:hypothetical protein CRENBAI_006799 [Crenichthys baileyi]|uniref:Uncharacterized protein n=1 Tax=Crenichthys baileyi TaxID=28760 RepID=A0AAV9RMQ7_9TELE